MKCFNLKAALLALTVLHAPCTAQAQEFSQYIGFGDSTLDSGYFRYHTYGNAGYDAAIANAIANGATGAFVGTGVMNSVQLAAKFGLTAEPSDNGGTNYAVGGAQTDITVDELLNTDQQIRNYLTAVNGVANSNGLYVIATGSNDLVFGQFLVPGWLDAQATALATQVVALQAAGARTILVTNPYNSAIFAGLGGDIADANAEAYARSQAYGNSIWAHLTAAGVNFIPVDEDSLFSYVVHNPTRFGFTATSVLATNAPCYASSALICTTMSAADMQSYLFVDGKHMTTAGQAIVADYEYSLLTAPSTISLIGESAVQGGLTRASAIQGQLDLSGQRRGPSGINAWVSAGANELSIENAPGFPDDPGTPFYGTVGVDYQLSNGLILGVAFTGGAQSQEFSTGGGFDQVDEAPSLYAAYKIGPVWGNAVATYGLFQEHIERPVTLHVFTDQNDADTTGHDLALALRGGGDFDVGQKVTTGPVMGVVMQRVQLDGFTEKGTSGVTALSFDTQTRDSLVSQFGWRGSLDLARWKPFVEAGWNHEWAKKENRVTASLTSVAAASYTVDAAPVAADWATASVGTSYQLNERVMLRGVISSVFANSQVDNYGGQLGVSVSF